MPIRTICWEKNRLKLIDQRLLPGKLRYITCSDLESVIEAIKTLAVRGAPAIGIAAAYGVITGLKETHTRDPEVFLAKLKKVTARLARARPTAVNLFWALERMEKAAFSRRGAGVEKIREALMREAAAIYEEDRKICRNLAGWGAGLLDNGDSVLTHCNAGALATADFGTALGVVYRASEEGKKIRVYADETRPLLQGARLTAWELKKHEIEVTLICDSAAGWVMKQGRVNKVLVGADRIALNGDSANKVGTYGLAVLAERHKIPFYVCAPLSTIDFSINSGEEIPIEERSASEITNFAGTKTAPGGVKVYAPAFDVVPSKLITAIVTERGVIEKPYKRKILRMKNQYGH